MAVFCSGAYDRGAAFVILNRTGAAFRRPYERENYFLIWVLLY